jgi:hypothetical protein
MLSIYDRGILQHQETAVALWSPNYVKYMPSASRVFCSSRSRTLGPGIKIDEFDFTSGKKVRTMSSGLTSTRDGTVRDVFSNESAVFSIVHTSNDQLAIQSFLQ